MVRDELHHFSKVAIVFNTIVFHCIRGSD